MTDTKVGATELVKPPGEPLVESSEKLAGPPIVGGIRDAFAPFREKVWHAIALFCLGIALGAGAAYFVMNERMATKDELLVLYRAKAEQLDKAAGSISTLTNTQLRARVTEVALGIRALAASSDEKIRGLMMRAYDPNETAEQRQAAWRATTAELTNDYFATAQQYNSRYKADALALRDEIVLRIRGPAPTPRLRAAYEAVAGAQPLEMIATDLEVLARKLPGP